MQPWIEKAKKEIGTKEIVGTKHNARVVAYSKRIYNGGIKTDEVPWCASFVGAMLEDCGIRSTRSLASQSYKTWGQKLTKPVTGCIVVFSRKGGGGHVGFCLGVDKLGQLIILGGNQSNAVNIKAFKKDRVVGYRYPTNHTPPTELKLLASASVSTSEA